MDAIVKPFELALLPLFKALPSLPENGRKGLVKIWPWLALVFGVLQLFAVYNLWQLGHQANVWLDYANQLSIATGGGVVNSSLGFTYYLALGAIAVDGVLLLLAFAPLRANKKSGWDLLFLGGLLNLVYGIVMAFDNAYGGASSLIGSLIGSFIGFYLLYQVRDFYTGGKSSTSPKA